MGRSFIHLCFLLAGMLTFHSCVFNELRKPTREEPEEDFDESLTEPDEIPDLPGSGVSDEDLLTLLPDGSLEGVQGGEHSPRVNPRRFEYAEGAYGIYTLQNGLVLPYPVRRVLRGFGKCVRGKRKHPAIDIAGVGLFAGLGTPIRAMVREKVIRIQHPEDDPKRFGRRDRRGGTVTRQRKELPRSKVLDGYGRVYFFTKNHGSWRTGTIIITQGLSGPLRGHRIRYMHLGAIRPDLQRNSILEPGEELGVMGSTAILESPPHVHIDIENPEGLRVDIEYLFGIEEEHAPLCGGED